MKWLLVVAALAGCAGRSLGLGEDGGRATDLAAAHDAAMRPDLAVGVQCGMSACDTSMGNVCCESFPPVCGPGPCGVGVQVDACDGPEDCPGQFCCLSVAPTFGASCLSNCTAG